ncbi:hypothetical protein L7F22_061229 [Adiantum nelumboides]|nr:hypothetical protein [Adiantum nelumboides]
MAVSYAKPSRAMPTCDSMDDTFPGNCDEKKRCNDDCKPSSAVEHWVLFNMPFLQGDQEAKILRALYDLQYQFDNVDAFIVGRVLNKVERVTHALYVRFPTVEMLKDYYKSEALSRVICAMLPHLHGEICVDYVSATAPLDTNQKEPMCATVTLMRQKRDVCSGEIDCALHTLMGAVDDLGFVTGFTAGSNVFIRGDKHFTHGFAGYVKSVCELEKLTENTHYSKVLHHKVLPLSCNTVTVNVLAFKPIKSCL